MKRQILMLAFALFTYRASAQESKPESPQHPSIDEMMKHTQDVLQKEVQLSPEQLKALAPTFKTFFTAAEKVRKDHPLPPPPPVDPKAKAEMDKLVKTRDENVKKVLTPAQYEKYKKAMMKMRPHRPERPEENGEAPPKN